MSPQQEIIQLITAEFLQSRFRDSAYSMRSMAKRLKSSPSVLSEILNGHRPITKATGLRLLTALNLPPEKVSQLVVNLPLRYTKAAVTRIVKAGKSPGYSQVDMSQFDAIANWYYFGILSLAETKKFKSDVTWIAERLNIKVSEAKKAVSALVRLGLLKKNKAGKLTPTGKQFETSTDISSPAIRKHHLQNLDVLRKSLEHDPVHLRDFSTTTVTFDPQEMQMAKDLINKFRAEFTNKVEKTKKKEVYRLSMQFIPLSKEKNQ